MSTCARCGRPNGWDWQSECVSNQEWDEDSDSWQKLATIECRDRELLAARSLLRSVTTKLEEAAELLEPPGDARAAAVARELVVGVLEVLS